MKLFKLLFLALAVTATTVSCSKDEDKIEDVSGNKYETTYAKITASYNGVEQSVEYDTAEELKNEELYLKVEFKSDNTFWVYEETGEDDVYDWFQAGTWSQSDSKITISVDGETLEIKVDGSKLIMIIDLDEMYSKKLGIDEEVITGSIEWHFSKI